MESMKTELKSIKTVLSKRELKTESIWRKTCPIQSYPVLDQHIETDVAIIGGGMTGILTAWHLWQAGVRTVVLEAGQIGNGQTQNTTAKITSQHGMLCHKLIEKKGEERAAKYFQANQAAVEMYKKIIGEQGISCDLEECNSYVYSSDDEKLKKETAAACRLGINASLVRTLEIPVACAGAVCFHGQARFHPLKFMKALAEDLTIYENSRAIHIEDHLVKTAFGSVKAGKIVFAAHFPFINFPGMYFARMHQERSYVLALENAPLPNGMYIGAEKNSYSFRSFGSCLLLGGEGHRCGENDEASRYQRLRKRAEQWFPKSREICCWSAQDCVTADSIPYIGKFSAGKEDWYVATGFQKWGMTTSMAAAMLLRDEICRIPNPNREIFSPQRFPIKDMDFFLSDGLRSAKELVRPFLKNPQLTAKDLMPGHGGIVTHEGKKIGIYKDEQGHVYAVKIRCPHLGCQLSWNPDEKSWDCPCHGSRFDYRGKLLNGPAQTPI